MLPEIVAWLNIIMPYLYKPDHCHQERKIHHKLCWPYVYVLAIHVYNNQETVITLQNKATSHYPNDTDYTSTPLPTHSPMAHSARLPILPRG